MSQGKKLLGLWLMLIAYLGVPVLYYFGFGRLGSAGLPTLPGQINVFLAAICVFGGIFWVSWAYSYLHFTGKGSPVELFGVALYPTQSLVTAGPYAYTRNPMMVGALFLLLAAGFAADSIIGIVLVPVLALIALWYIKAFEEPQLVRRFGDGYVKYRQSVRALIPSLTAQTTDGRP